MIMMRPTLSLAAVALALVAASAAATAAPAWDDLASALTSPDLLRDGGFDAWAAECVVPLEEEWTTACAYPPFTDCRFGAFVMGPSNYRFIDRPQDYGAGDPSDGGGQCMVFGQNCAHTNCQWPYTEEEEAGLFRGINSHPDAMNLPAKTAFPASVGDVVRAVNFAAENDVDVKVKSTGHSSFGDSTGRDALLIHMRNMPKYSDPDAPSKGLDAIVECDSSDSDADSSGGGMDMDALLCALAEARGRKAHLRVGGGQIFDEVLRTVNNFNGDASREREYHVVSGASGTVGAAGGWLQGGGLGLTQNGRAFGFGVDQTLQFEMVLPAGRHVRFGPAEWADAPGYRQPRTTAVRGVCNANPHAADESGWAWEECPEDVPFDDLWFAVRGGGGASYGIVTAVYYQLHDKPGDMELVVMGPFAEDAAASPLTPVWVDFYLDFFVDPESIGVAAEQSNLCGSYIGIHSFASTHGSVFFCFGGAGSVFTSAWSKYVLNRTDSLMSAGLTTEDISAAANATAIATFPSYQYFALNIPEALSTLKNQNTPEGRVADLNPGVFIHRGFTGMSMYQVPVDVVLEKKSALSAFITSVVRRVGTMKAYQMGGNHRSAHDQMSAMPPAGREAAFLLETPDDDDKGVLFELIFGEGASGSSFPGLYCHNIALQNDWGPLKGDWSKPCNTSWSIEEKNKECIPFQEAVWGTELLEKLEGIKTALDPKSLFVQGYGVKGIGPNQELLAEEIESPSDGPTASAKDEPTPAADASGGQRLTGILSLGWAMCLAATGILLSQI